MDVVISPVFEEKCETCKKCVQVVCRSDALDFSAPCLKTECSRQDCPIAKNRKPGPIDIVEIYFVDC
jgi:hypothetical protein